MNYPTSIARRLKGEQSSQDSVGMSGSSVLIFPDKVLKIQKQTKESDNEYRMMKWFEGKLPTPRVLEYEVQDGQSFLLMSRCEGVMMCHDQFMNDTVTQVKILAEAIHSLWNTDITGCPSNQCLENKLKDIEYIVEHHLIDMENVEPTTFGGDGFKSPEALLQWLYDNKPEEELVLSHGDFCLPNVFGKDDRCTGFIDLGRTGVADKWMDVALCYRSLSNNYSGRYHSKNYSKIDDNLLFKALDVEPNWDKINYYILLDEFF